MSDSKRNHYRVVIIALALAVSGLPPAQAQETAPGSDEQDEDLVDLYSQPAELEAHEAIAPLSPATQDSGPSAALQQDFGPQTSETGLNIRVTGSGGTQSEISMAATGGGGQNIVISYNGGPNGLGFVSSQNGGQTFQAEQSPPVPTGSNPCCDPSVVADNASNFFLIQLFRDDGANAPSAGNCTNSLHVSNDGGQTFSGIFSSPFSYPPGSNDFPDQPHIGINRSNSNELYVFTRHFTSGINCPQTGGSGTVQGEIVCSNDGGVTWSNPFVFPTFTDLAHIDVAPDGRAFVVGNGVGMNMGTSRVLLWRSSATSCPGAGNTPNFTGPTVVDDNLTFGQVVDREFPQPTVIADPTTNDRVYVNYSADDTQGSGDREAFLSRCDFVLFVMLCTAPLTVNDNPADGSDQYFPMACIDPASNDIFVSWNDDRSGLHEIRATNVTNSGTTTNPSRAVSEAQWSIVNFPGTPDYGDYNENNGACRANHHYAAWTSQVSPPGITPPSSNPDVFFAVVNEPPVADAAGPYSTVEGTNVTLSGSAVDPENDTPFTFDWDFDNDGEFDDATGSSPSFDMVGQDGSFTVCLRVTDSIGDSGEDCTTVTVNNLAPTITNLATDAPGDENSPITLQATVIDPGWLENLSATVDWDDGNGPQPVTGNLENERPEATLELDVPFTYGDNGVFTAELCASDDHGTVCQSINVQIDNVAPTAEIDLVGTLPVGGTDTFLAHAGEELDFAGRSTDPGSDDLIVSWDWDDGPPAPDVTTTYLVNPPDLDPFPSPTIQPRDITDEQSHTFEDACRFDITFGAVDDDGGTASDTVPVLISGNANKTRPAGWWQTQTDGFGAEFLEDELVCYLQITRFASEVFDEKVPLSTRADAQTVLKPPSVEPLPTQRLDRELLAAWLNFANGAVDFLDVIVDTDGDGVADTTFADAVAAAEAVRLNPASTPAELREQQMLLLQINRS